VIKNPSETWRVFPPKSKDRQYNVNGLRKAMIYKALHRKLKIEHHEPHQKLG
jgi:hypothetical protein